MIIKICEEMRQVRINEDYMNYRTLVNILKDYISTDIFHITYNFNDDVISTDVWKDQYDLIRNISKWIRSEIKYIQELLDSSLENKNYKDFKVLSQCDITLNHLDNGLKDVLNRLDRRRADILMSIK